MTPWPPKTADAPAHGGGARPLGRLWGGHATILPQQGDDPLMQPVQNEGCFPSVPHPLQATNPSLRISSALSLILFHFLMLGCDQLSICVKPR